MKVVDMLVGVMLLSSMLRALAWLLIPQPRMVELRQEEVDRLAAKDRTQLIAYRVVELMWVGGYAYAVYRLAGGLTG